MNDELPSLPNAPHRFAVEITNSGERMDYTAKDMRDYALASIAPYKARIDLLERMECELMERRWRLIERAEEAEATAKMMAGAADTERAERKRLEAEVAKLRVELHDLRNVTLEIFKAENAKLRELLSEAADDIESWGAYATDYFQKKHDLAGCVQRFRDAALKGKP